MEKSEETNVGVGMSSSYNTHCTTVPKRRKTELTKDGNTSSEHLLFENFETTDPTSDSKWFSDHLQKQWDHPTENNYILNCNIDNWLRFWNGCLLKNPGSCDLWTNNHWGLVDMFPDSDVLMNIVRMISMGILFSFQKRCLKKPCQGEPVISKGVRHSDGYHWYCPTCRGNWSVRVGSIFENMTFPLFDLIRILFSVLNPELGISWSVQYIPFEYFWTLKFRYTIEVWTCKYNQLFPPHMEGNVQFDELILKGIRTKLTSKSRSQMSSSSSSSSVTESTDKKINISKLSQVWGFHMVNSDTKKVRVGVSQGRRASEIATFCLGSLKQKTKDPIDFVTDEWGGSKKVKYNDVSGFNIRHHTVNHSQSEFVSRDGYHTNRIESLNGRARKFILNQLNGSSDIDSMTKHFNFWMGIWNQNNSTDFNKPTS